MREVLVTGGAGFIGYHLARQLSEDPGVRVTLLDDLRRGRLDEDLRELLERPNVCLWRRTVDQLDVESDLDFEDVYHLAAVNGTATFYERPADVLETNILALVHALRYCAFRPSKRRLLFTSSNEAYAGALEAFDRLPIPTPEDVPLVVADVRNPRWSYGGSKLVGEQLVMAYARQHGVRAVVVRPHNFYGPRAGYGHVVPQLCQRILAREDPFRLPGADETRSFCFIADAVDALARCMTLASQDVPLVHVGTEKEIPIELLARTLFHVAEWEPGAIARAPSPPGSVLRRCPSIARLHDLTGWFPSTSLREGLRATFAWYAAHPETASS